MCLSVCVRLHLLALHFTVIGHLALRETQILYSVLPFFHSFFLSFYCMISHTTQHSTTQHITTSYHVTPLPLSASVSAPHHTTPHQQYAQIRLNIQSGSKVKYSKVKHIIFVLLFVLSTGCRHTRTLHEVAASPHRQVL